jgi:hypothetical protein
MEICEDRTKRLVIKLCYLLLLLSVLLACRLGGDNSSRRSSSSDRKSKDGPNAELCRKYDSCGCQSYDQCMEKAEGEPNLEKPGVRECMLNSSCESLCAGKPDGCTGGSSSGQGGDTTPRRSDCANIQCSKNSDCPSDCYGGCDGVRCYSF